MRLLLAEDEGTLQCFGRNFEAQTIIPWTPCMMVQTPWTMGVPQNYDGMILDIMMPKLDGLQVLSRLRAEGIATPVLMLTAKSEIDDRITGLDTGADDYLTKPLQWELLARIAL